MRVSQKRGDIDQLVVLSERLCIRPEDLERIAKEEGMTPEELTNLVVRVESCLIGRRRDMEVSRHFHDAATRPAHGAKKPNADEQVGDWGN